MKILNKKLALGIIYLVIGIFFLAGALFYLAFRYALNQVGPLDSLAFIVIGFGIALAITGLIAIIATLKS